MKKLYKFGIFAVVLLAVSTWGTGTVAAQPPEEPDHGYNQSEFEKLWSGDEADPDYEPGPNASFTEVMSKSSDFSFMEPPETKQWNLGELTEISGLDDPRESIYPSDAEIDRTPSSSYIKDAYVEVFAIEPSTIFHKSPTETVRYVQNEGEVLALVDYRVELPPGKTLVDHEIVETQVLGIGNGSNPGNTNTPIISYSGGPFSTVKSTIRVRVDNGTGIETETTDVVTDVQTRPISSVVPIEIINSVEYPDGDRGAMFLKILPWSKVELPNGDEIHTNIRFFTTRDPSWDKLEVSNRSGTYTIKSDDFGAIPLEVHAYPSKNGPFVESDNGEAKIKSTFPTKAYEAPTLPNGVDVDVVDGKYNRTSGIEVRYKGDSPLQLDGTKFHSIVREDVSKPSIGSGNSALSSSTQINQRIKLRKSNLTLSKVAENETHVTLHVILRDARSGRFINLKGREVEEDPGGYVRLMANMRVKTSADGKALVTINKPNDYVRAKYIPIRFYQSSTDRAYVGDEATLAVNNEFVSSLGLLTVLMKMFGFLLPFALMVMFAGRILGMDLWPPWKKI